MTTHSLLTAQSGAYKTAAQTTQLNNFIRRTESSDEAELRKVCDDFEALFVKMMLDSMRETLNDNSLIPKNASEKMFEEQLFDEYAQKIGKTADFGIADIMYNQMSVGIPGSRVNLSS